IRDCDVHLASLKETDEAPQRIVSALKDERRAARKKLKALRRRLEKGDRFEDQIKKLLGGIAWPKRHSSRAAPPFGSWCHHELTPLASEFFKLATANLHDDATLHALRIAGKGLRYALELAPA